MGDDVSAHVELIGANAFAKALPTLGDEVKRRILREIMWDGMKVYARDMQRRVPKITRDLEHAIRAKRVTTTWADPHGGVEILNKTGWYWHMVEWGTRGYAKGERRYSTGVAGGIPGIYKGRVRGGHHATKAKPYIRPAIDSYYNKWNFLVEAKAIGAQRVEQWRQKVERDVRRATRQAGKSSSGKSP